MVANLKKYEDVMKELVHRRIDLVASLLMERPLIWVEDKPSKRHEMDKAISILESHVRAYRSQVELYEHNPNNQAITEHSAKEARRSIIELQEAIDILKKMKLR